MSQADQALRINYSIGGNYDAAFKQLQTGSMRTMQMLDKSTSQFNTMTGSMGSALNVMGSAFQDTDDLMTGMTGSMQILDEEMESLISTMLTMGSVVDEDLGRALKVMNKTSGATALAVLGIKKGLDKGLGPAVEKNIKRFEKGFKVFTRTVKVLKGMTEGHKKLEKFLQNQSSMTIDVVTNKWNTFLEGMTSGPAVQEVLKINDAVTRVSKTIKLNAAEEEMLKDISLDLIATSAQSREAIIGNLGALVKVGIRERDTLIAIESAAQKVALAAENVDPGPLGLFLAQMKSTVGVDPEKLSSGLFSLHQQSAALYEDFIALGPEMEKVLQTIPEENRLDALGNMSSLLTVGKNAFADTTALTQLLSSMTEVTQTGTAASSKFASALMQIAEVSGPEVFKAMQDIRSNQSLGGLNEVLMSLQGPLKDFDDTNSIVSSKAKFTFERVAEAFNMPIPELIKLTKYIGENQGAFEKNALVFKAGTNSMVGLTSAANEQSQTLDLLSIKINDIGNAVMEDFYRPLVVVKEWILGPIFEATKNLLMWLKDLPQPIKDIGFAITLVTGLGFGTFLVMWAAKTIGVTAALGGLNMAMAAFPAFGVRVIGTMQSLGLQAGLVGNTLGFTKEGLVSWWQTMGKGKAITKGAEVAIGGYNEALKGVKYGLTAIAGAAGITQADTTNRLNRMITGLAGDIKSDNQVFDAAKDFSDRALSPIQSGFVSALSNAGRQIKTLFKDTLLRPLAAGFASLASATATIAAPFITAVQWTWMAAFNPGGARRALALSNSIILRGLGIIFGTTYSLMTGFVVTMQFFWASAFNPIFAVNPLKNMPGLLARLLAPVVSVMGGIISLLTMSLSALSVVFTHLAGVAWGAFMMVVKGAMWAMATTETGAIIVGALTTAFNWMGVQAAAAWVVAAGPVAWVVGIIMGLYAAIMLMPDYVGKAIVGATKWLSDFFASIPGAISSMINFIPSLIDRGVQMIIDMVSSIPDLLSGKVKEGTAGVTAGLGEQFMSLVGSLAANIVKTVISILTGIPMFIIKMYVSVLKGIVSLVIGLFSILFSVDFWWGMGEALISVVSSAFSMLGSMLLTLISPLIDFANWIGLISDETHASMLGTQKEITKEKEKQTDESEKTNKLTDKSADNQVKYLDAIGRYQSGLILDLQKLGIDRSGLQRSNTNVAADTPLPTSQPTTPIKMLGTTTASPKNAPLIEPTKAQPTNVSPINTIQAGSGDSRSLLDKTMWTGWERAIYEQGQLQLEHLKEIAGGQKSPKGSLADMAASGSKVAASAAASKTHAIAGSYGPHRLGAYHAIHGKSR